MTFYERNDLLALIDAYCELVGFHVSNATTHIVTEDYNLEDSHIDYCLKWIEEHRAEWVVHPDEGITGRDVAIAIAFLNFLKAIPEERRVEHWEDDGDDQDDIPVPPVFANWEPDAPKWSEDWLRRHGE